ncbi:GWxTD domain-containing protein [candidate division TA06 bacterium]|uniref:GWxTD domain-containing protein n=1 Tax=candidate division TA06 bacterium TaxID=2250710 RepID=A0A523UN64_UNCT6|nr:MAG: GWxTD domain-containing protein [candidate division TA06 bacterium]
MKTITLVLVLWLILLFSFCAYASQPPQHFPAESKGDLDFVVDAVRFRNPAGINLLQVFYDLPYGQLSLGEKKESGYAVEFQIDVEVKSTSTGNVQKSSWTSSSQVRSKEEALRKKLSGVDQFEIELKGGVYELSLTIKDLNSKRSGSAVGRIEFPELGSVLALSDVQLATSITVDTIGSNFTRGNIKVIPNPKRVFGDNLRFLYPHFEIYNMKFDAANPGTYSTTYSILNEQGEVVTTLPPTQSEKLGHTGVGASAVNVLGLLPGRYLLQVEIKDSSTGQSAKATSSFEVARLKPRRPLMGGWAEEYFDRIDLLAGQDTFRFMRSLSPNGQEQFLIDFWLRRDPTPGTPQNEFFDAFAARVKEADEMFRSGLERGIASDRGKIYIKYGKPDDTESYPTDPDYPAHEDWFYYREGGIQFIFSDISGIGKYELVYSSTEDEFFDPNWRQYIDEAFIKKQR